MSTLSIIAIVVALAAVVGLCLGLADSWFFGLLALACLFSAADTAYHELKLWTLVYLLTAAALCGAALRAAYANSRQGGDT